MRETEPTGSTMFSATAASKETTKTEERRSFHRERLKHYVVLVFFGEDNWGKLTNMSESGMAIEFDKPPSLRERVNFTFQAMGCMPVPRDGKGLGDSFEAPGKIVWTREFERGAGVQFVDMPAKSRAQIRQWLSFEASPNMSNPEPGKPEGPILGELVPPIAPGSNPQSAEERKKTLNHLDMPVPFADVQPEPDFAFAESSIGEGSHEVPGWSDRREPAKEPRVVPESSVASHSSAARLTFLVVSGCLAAFAVTAGVRIFMTREARQAETAVQASHPAPRGGQPAANTAEVNVSSPVPPPVSLPAASGTSSAATSAASAPPFQVNVVDENGRSWILWFVHGDAKNKDDRVAGRPAEPSNSSAPTLKIAERAQSAPPEKPQAEAAHTFTMSIPNVSHPLNTSSAGQPSAEAPAIQPELTPSSGDPFGGALGSQMKPVKPAAPALRPPTGGMVQQPRLIRMAPLVYPQLAKQSRVSGDVIVDALIDAKGNVVTVKVISGPVLLQQAAMDTVRHWKYDPARLDGQAVSMHLSVTVRFRLS